MRSAGPRPGAAVAGNRDPLAQGADAHAATEARATIAKTLLLANHRPER
jgi:hypothetical protein